MICRGGEDGRGMQRKQEDIRGYKRMQEDIRGYKRIKYKKEKTRWYEKNYSRKSEK